MRGGQARRRTVRREALLEPLLGLPAQLPGLVERVAFGGAGKARQEGLCGADAERAAHRDLDRRLHGVRQIAKQLGHLRPGLEMVLGRQAAPVLVADEASFGDGEERVVSLVVVAPAEEGLVRGDERQPVAVGKRDELRLDRPLLIEAVALDLDIEPIAEGIAQGREPRLGEVAPAAEPERGVERARRPAGEGDETGGVRGEERRGDARRVAERHVEIGPARKPHQVAVALFALRQQHEVRRLDLLDARCRVRRLELHRKLHPGDRLDALLGKLLGKLERAEEVVGIGQRQRRLPVGRRELREIGDLERALEKRVGRVHVQVHEADVLQDLRHRAVPSGRHIPESQGRSRPRTRRAGAGAVDSGPKAPARSPTVSTAMPALKIASDPSSTRPTMSARAMIPS